MTSRFCLSFLPILDKKSENKCKLNNLQKKKFVFNKKGLIFAQTNHHKITNLRMDTIKTFFVSVLSAIWAYLDPIAGNIESLTGLFILNFFVGWMTGMIINDEGFQLKKVKECFVWAAAILVIVCSFYFIGERNGNEMETIFCVKTISVVAMWAFGTNIFRNLCLLSRGYKPAYNLFYLLYIIISVEFIKMIPSVREYVERDKKETADKLGEEYHKFEWNNNEEPVIEESYERTDS